MSHVQAEEWPKILSAILRKHKIGHIWTQQAYNPIATVFEELKNLEDF